MFALALFALLLGLEEPSLQEYRHGEGLSIRMVDSSGTPLPGVTLELHVGDVGTDPECRDWKKAEGVEFSNNKGEAVFHLEEPGSFCLRASLDGFVPVRVGPFAIDSFEVPRRSVVVPIVVVMTASVQG